MPVSNGKVQSESHSRHLGATAALPTSTPLKRGQGKARWSWERGGGPGLLDNLAANQAPSHSHAPHCSVTSSTVTLKSFPPFLSFPGEPQRGQHHPPATPSLLLTSILSPF